MEREDDITRMYREHAHHLQLRINALDCEARQREQMLELLQKENGLLKAQNLRLKKQVQELSVKARQAAAATAKTPPDFVKPARKAQAKKKPGRKPGHRPDHRPKPAKIDRHLKLPLPRDGQGGPSCPDCHARLTKLQQHQRIVEDIIPAKLIVTCYHTQSGYCPGCRRRIESRAPEQPPAAGVCQSQLGINALATAALLRVNYRLPYRQITELLADLPGLALTPGAVAKQIQRMAGWLEGQYDRLKVFLRRSPWVHMDETSWRTDGVNGWLWTMLNQTHTCYHVDGSRSQEVVKQLLGEAFGGTLISDFYSAYTGMDCAKQKCLVHLLRELRDTAAKSPAFAKGRFHRRCKQLIKQLLLLKKQSGQLCGSTYQRRGRQLEQQLAELARARWKEANAKRLADRLQRHAQELTGFLWQADLPGDNNAAERALRPAVVMRKITGGSRSEKGARAWAVLASILRTARQQHRDLFDTLKTLLAASWAGRDPALLTDLAATA